MSRMSVLTTSSSFDPLLTEYDARRGTGPGSGYPAGRRAALPVAAA